MHRLNDGFIHHVQVYSTIFGVIFSVMPANGQTLPFPPDQAKICIDSVNNRDKIVDKQKLAQYALKAFPFNAASIPNGSAPAGLDIPRWILSDPNICKNKDSCTDQDKSNLVSVRGYMSQVLSGQIPGYKITVNGVDPNDYFKGSNEQNMIICESQDGKPIEAPGAVFIAPPKSSSGFRIRGKVDDLYIDRSNTKPFQSTSQAIINFAADETAKRRTDTFQGVLGYRFETDLLKENGQRFDLIPYFQINRVIVSTSPGSTAKPSTNEIIDFGLTGNMFLVSSNGIMPIGHVINLRPDYLLNLQDESRILSLNFQYIPTINSFLNDYRRFVSESDNFISYKFMLDMRVDGGIYTDRGLPSVAASNKDYYRLGGQSGFSIISDNSNIPLSFVTTYTGLYGIAGGVNIGYFSNNLTYNFDPNKFFGLSVGYTTGRREDTAKREQLWSVGLSGRF